MTTKEFEALKVGAPREEVEQEHGVGSDNGQDIPEPAGLECSYYEARGSGARADAFQLCFAGGKLAQTNRIDVAGGGSGGGGFD